MDFRTNDSIRSLTHTQYGYALKLTSNHNENIKTPQTYNEQVISLCIWYSLNGIEHGNDIIHPVQIHLNKTDMLNAEMEIISSSLIELNFQLIS